MYSLTAPSPPPSQVETHAGKTIERLEIHISSVCGQACVFCSESRRMETFQKHPISYESMIKTLIRKRQDGCKHVTFTGGEPTLYPHLPRVLKAAKKLGYRTYITTDASRLSQKNYASKVIPLLDEICISIHSNKAATHDILAKTPGSFKRVLAAFSHIATASPQPYLLTNTVLTRFNIDQISETVEFLAQSGIVRHCTISNLAPDGAGLKNFEKIACRLRQMTPLTKSLSDISRRTGIVVRFFGTPLCVLGNDWDLPNDLHWTPRVTVERGMVGGQVGLHEIFSPHPGRMRFYAPKCKNCSLREKSCFGVFRKYYNLYGEDELKPLQTKNY
jgi:organic radical activating enzyme